MSPLLFGKYCHTGNWSYNHRYNFCFFKIFATTYFILKQKLNYFMSLLLFWPHRHCKLAIEVQYSMMKVMQYLSMILFLFTNYQQSKMLHLGRGPNMMRCPPMYTNRGSKNDNLCLRFEYQSTTITYIYTTCFELSP